MNHAMIWILGGSLLAATGCKKKEVPAAGGSGETKVVDGGAKKPPETPAATGGTLKVVKIGAGDGFACAVMDSGAVRCWGKNDKGERGTKASRDDAATPVDVPGVANAVDLVAGGETGDIACAWTKDKDVWCWGSAGLIPDKGGAAPHAIPALKGALSIAVGGGTGYAVKPDGTVWGWGSAAFNALADGTMDSSKPLAQIPGVTGAKQVVAGQNHGCALLGDGTVTCWGYSKHEQLPTVVEGLAGATAVFSEAQRGETCALTKDATVCWNEYQMKPTPKPDLAGVVKIAGRNHLCAIGGDGAVSCWGDDNQFGQLGNSDPKSRKGKVEGLAKKAIDIAVGHVFACAALEDGTAACWGYNPRGQLGDGSLMDRKAATAVAGLTAKTLAPAKNGQDAMQEGATVTAWDGLPAACKNGPIEVVSKNYEGKAFTVKGARAKSQADGKTISIDLADHAFHASWGQPRGTQAELGFRLAKVEIKGDKRDPVAVDLGEYKIGLKEERLVSPTLETKTGSVSLISISLAGIDAGKLTVTHLDDKWVCGELAIAADSTSVKGSFAAPLTK